MSHLWLLYSSDINRLLWHNTSTTSTPAGGRRTKTQAFKRRNRHPGLAGGFLFGFQDLSPNSPAHHPPASRRSPHQIPHRSVTRRRPCGRQGAAGALHAEFLLQQHPDYHSLPPTLVTGKDLIDQGIPADLNSRTSFHPPAMNNSTTNSSPANRRAPQTAATPDGNPGVGKDSWRQRGCVLVPCFWYRVFGTVGVPARVFLVPWAFPPACFWYRGRSRPRVLSAGVPPALREDVRTDAGG